MVDLNTMQESLEESTDDEEEAEEVKTVKEVMGDVSVSDIISAIERIKTAKDNDNSANGLVSNNMDFRDAREERFLFDTGAKICQSPAKCKCRQPRDTKLDGTNYL